MRGTVKRRKRRTRMPRLAVVILGLLVLDAVLLLALSAVQKGQSATAQSDTDDALLDAQGDVSGLFTVCIDPGHGGSDVGASWEGRLEKDDNLAVALALRDALTALDVRCVLTRETDEYISLADRVALAEEQEADYYISLHRNYVDADACGVELWVAEGCSTAAETLALRLDTALVSVGVQRDRGVRYGSEDGEGSYYVLRSTSMPAVLVELGFLQNEEDTRLLDGNLESSAAAMADALFAAWEAEEGA